MNKRRFTIHPLLWAILASIAFYFLFKAIQPPIPRSLLIQYMVFVVIGVLMVVSFDDSTFARFSAPVYHLLGNPALSWVRWPVFMATALGVSWMTWQQVLPDISPPVELRSVHPAPPNAIQAFGKRINLSGLENPFRVDDPEQLTANTHEGGEIYFKNCFYCHGDKLDGTGHFAEAFNPLPANFQDVGTIAQLTESFLFWRIATGGPGLPREGAPWNSAMPVWHEMLSEEQVWKVILFLYDYTDRIPRSWSKESKLSTNKKSSAPTPEENYARRCAWCHGPDGMGDGPAAEFLYPRPRDFTLGMFKYKDTPSSREFPTDEGLQRIIRDGLRGTSMPGWGDVLSEREIRDLIPMIKEFGGWTDVQPEGLAVIDLGTAIPSSPESIGKGEELFAKTCVQCHGEKGRGNITSGKKLTDDYGYRIWPRNLTQPWTWRATQTREDIFRRLSGGILGTPMPEHATTISIEERWHIVNFVWSLREDSVPLDSAKTVIAARRVEGTLPAIVDDPAWRNAHAVTFRLAPNVIKEPRLFTPLNDAITARALYNDQEIAFLLEVDDRTYSLPGDPLEQRYRIDKVEPASDAVAIELPAALAEGMEKPLYRHGDAGHPVNIWYWNAGSKDPERAATTAVLDGRGPDVRPEPRAESNVSASGAWHEGRWRVLFKRRLITGEEKDLSMEPGRFIPIAFANWDGTNGEKGGRHTLTTWNWLLLEPPISLVRIYGYPLGAGFGTLLLLLWLSRGQLYRFTLKKEN